MENQEVPYEQGATGCLSADITKVECHRYEMPDVVEVIESYIEEA